MVRYAEPANHRITAMGTVVNLGRARKRKREDAEKRRADENAIRHGRTRAEKTREHMEQARQRANVDGARLEPVQADTTSPSEHSEEPSDEPEA
jgi:hypothetical protein